MDKSFIYFVKGLFAAKGEKQRKLTTFWVSWV